MNFTEDEKVILLTLATQLITTEELQKKISRKELEDLEKELEDFTGNRSPNYLKELGVSTVYKLIDIALENNKRSR